MPDNVLQFRAPPKTETERIGEYDVTYTYKPEQDEWEFVIPYTKAYQLTRTAKTLEAARKQAATQVQMLEEN